MRYFEIVIYERSGKWGVIRSYGNDRGGLFIVV